MIPRRSSTTKAEPSTFSGTAASSSSFKHPRAPIRKKRPQKRGTDSEDDDEVEPMEVDGDAVEKMSAETTGASQQPLGGDDQPSATPRVADENESDDADEEEQVAKKQEECASLADLRTKINFYLYELERNSTKFTGMHNKHKLYDLLNKYHDLSQKVSRTREMVLEGKLLDAILNLCVQCLAGVSQTWTLDDFIQRAGKRLYGPDYDGTDVGLAQMRPKAFHHMHRTLNACTAARDPNLQGVHCLFGRMNLLQAPPAKKERRKPVREQFEKTEKNPTRMQGQTAEAKEEEAIVKRVEKLRENIVKSFRECKRQPLSLWHLIIDPESFENSVQSLFLFLYLCKEGFIIIDFSSDEKWPTLVPISDDASIDAKTITAKLTQQRAEDFHWMPTFTMPQWEKYCEAIVNGN